MVTLSPYLVAAGLAWLIAHLLKYLIASVKARNPRQFQQFYSSGSMPSAHSATTVSLVTIIGLIDGVNTPVFAVAALLSAITMYDAMTVRRSSGEQGLAITTFLTQMKSKVKLPRVAKGHTPSEVLVGALIGFLIAVIVHVAF